MADIIKRLEDLGGPEEDKKKKRFDNPLGIPSAPRTAEAAGVGIEPAAPEVAGEDRELTQLALREPEIRKWFDEKQAEIGKKFAAKEKATQRAQMAQMLSQAVAQFGAALAGQKSGVDMSNLKFVKQDFEKQLDRLAQRRAAEESGLKQELGARRRLGELVSARREREEARKAGREEREAVRTEAREERAVLQEEKRAAKSEAVAVQREQLELKRQMADPDSETSKKLQQAAKGITGQDFTGFSAQDIRGVLPTLAARKAQAGARPELTEAEKVVDKEFAKTYSEFIIKGGHADVKRQLQDLKGVSKALERLDTASGKIVGSMPKFMRDIVTPKGSALQDVAESVVQRSLKKILGGQFGEKEGDRLIQRAYNPRLDESENKVRIDKLLQQMKEAAEITMEASEFYEKHGTLKGFKKKLFTSPDDFLTDVPARGLEDEPVQRSATEGRVRVRDAQGRVGTIPAAQLDDAIKAGFEKVE
jgi:hypothetical protein